MYLDAAQQESTYGGYGAMATSVLKEQPLEKARNVGMSVTSPLK